MLWPWKQANKVNQRYLLPDLKSLVILQNSSMTRGEIKVNIEEAFDRWRRLPAEKGFKTDADLAHVLLIR